jgi:hypothetical protein
MASATTWPSLPSRIYSEAAELKVLLRHFRGLGVHHTSHFSYDLVSPLTESFRNAGKQNAGACWTATSRPSRTEDRASPSRRLRSK